MRVTLITQPYNTHGKGRGGGAGPAALVAAGVPADIADLGHPLSGPHAVELTPGEEARYGDWLRVGAANAQLAGAVAAAAARDDFALVLGADCNSVLGVLGGLARSDAEEWPHRVGLVWVDAHADYNTPETSPSGMLGGMPVAAACGKCLHRLRQESGLRVPLQSPDVLMIGLRDVDPPEKAALAEDMIACVSAAEFVTGGFALTEAMRRLSQREDVIYVHVDLDILDPGVAPAAGLPAAGGITGGQLGTGLAGLLAYPKVAALALVSYSPARDADGGTLEEVRGAIKTAMAGLPRGDGGVR